jgi:hypothetical protein
MSRFKSTCAKKFELQHSDTLPQVTVTADKVSVSKLAYAKGIICCIRHRSIPSLGWFALASARFFQHPDSSLMPVACLSHANIMPTSCDQASVSAQHSISPTLSSSVHPSLKVRNKSRSHLRRRIVALHAERRFKAMRFGNLDARHRRELSHGRDRIREHVLVNRLHHPYARNSRKRRNGALKFDRMGIYRSERVVERGEVIHRHFMRSRVIHEHGETVGRSRAPKRDCLTNAITPSKDKHGRPWKNA